MARWLLEPTHYAPVVQVITGLFTVMTVLKAYLLVFVAILLRWTTPRVRIDQLLIWVGSSFALPCQPFGDGRTQTGFPCRIWRLITLRQPFSRHHGEKVLFTPSSRLLAHVRIPQTGR